MKKNLARLMTFSTCMLVMNSAYAYKYIIYTDDTKTDKAEQISELMRTTYPFSKFDIDVEIVTVKPEELPCDSTNGIDRLVTCETSDDLQKRTMQSGGDQAMILKDSSKYGGSSHIGSGVPVITTESDPRTMLHEYLHTLGLCDEYEYKQSEAIVYCGRDRDNRPNVALIDPLDPYGSDSMAKAKHSIQIPWFGDILSTTPITNTDGTRLGTGDVDPQKRAARNETGEPQVLGEPTGLYKGKVCNNAYPRPKTSWQPGSGTTIMENTNAGLGAPLEKIVEKLLVSKGVRTKLQFMEEGPVAKPAVQEEPAGSVVVDSHPMEKINDTARSFVKSFFSWTKDFFESVRKVLSR